MRVLCILGIHQWDRCTCARCRKVRDYDHEWDDWRYETQDSCKQVRTCVRCRKMETHTQHEWEEWQCKRCGILNRRFAAEEMGEALVDLIGSARFARYVLPRGISAIGRSGGGAEAYRRVWKARCRLITRLTSKELSETKSEILSHCVESFRKGINFSGSFSLEEELQVRIYINSRIGWFKAHLSPVLDVILETDEPVSEGDPPLTWITKVAKAISSSMD